MPRERACIVVAEDDDLTAAMILAVLRDVTWRAVWAADGEAAIQMVEQHRPQVLVLDLYLPIRTGLEVLRILRKRPDANGCRILVLTAQAQIGTEQEARANGADDFLRKPFDPLELKARVEQLLREEREEAE